MLMVMSMEYSRNDKLWIWLSIAFECNARQAHIWVQESGGIEAFYDEVVTNKCRSFPSLPNNKVKSLLVSAPIAHIDDFIARFDADGVYAITFESEQYPELLKNIYDPPCVLYCKGQKKLSEMKLPFAIVGSRRCTDYGEKMAGVFGRALSDCGMTIVSGLAYGCDAHAAKGAMGSAKNDFPTVAVLGQGVSLRKNDYTQYIMDEILEKGTVISEMLPVSKPMKQSYPLRNRIISGLSAGVLVVEAGESSGTSITANAALEQGRAVFAIPGRLTDRMSAGTNKLLRSGAAQAVYCVEDILDYFGIKYATLDTLKQDRARRNTQREELDEAHKLLYSLIEKGEKSFDALCYMSGFTVDELNLYLTEMEFSGLIKQLSGRIYMVE